MLLAGQLILGLVMLAYGAEWLVRGASRLALAAGLTPLVVGLTVVAFGTSAPELITSVVAGLRGSSGIALGNIIGSNIANIALILGAAATIRRIPVQSEVIRRDMPIMVIMTILFFILLKQQWFGTISGIVFIALLILFTTWQIYTSRLELPGVSSEFAREVGDISEPIDKSPIAVAVGLTIVGLVVLATGGRFLVESAVQIAQLLGISDRIIGLTIVAVGTSLPELAATVVAVLRNEPDVAVGNVVGSNIFNILLIGGVVGLLGGSAVATPVGISTDLWVMLAVTTFASVLLLTERALFRREGAILLVIYFGYIAWLVFFSR
ncbi:MAG: Inner membrane protein YrbG [bacterium]|nr:Inner membrane protein YrbG [bacterium]